MKKNMGKTDKAVRTLIALVIAALSYFDIITGVLGNVLLVLAIVLLITSFINFCPLYTLFGMNTRKNEE